MENHNREVYSIAMDVQKITEYLRKELPDFKFIPGTETPHEENWNSIMIVRDDKELTLDVSKVENDEGLENLRVYIDDLWKRSQA